MRVGDLVYLKPKNSPINFDYMGLIINRKQVGANKAGMLILYDILLAETEEVMTVSDIYFKIWRIE